MHVNRCGSRTRWSTLASRGRRHSVAAVMPRRSTARAAHSSAIRVSSSSKRREARGPPRCMRARPHARPHAYLDARPARVPTHTPSCSSTARRTVSPECSWREGCLAVDSGGRREHAQLFYRLPAGGGAQRRDAAGGAGILHRGVVGPAGRAPSRDPRRWDRHAQRPESGGAPARTWGCLPT